MPSQPTPIIAAEIARLPASQRLVVSGDLEVYDACWAQVPRLMLEIGRLRELTFRAVGEGTGQPIDLDRYDRTYRQLFVWDRAQQKLVGGYRLGDANELLARGGEAGLYTTTLFRFRPELLRALGNSLELGRSFVRAEYQRTSSALALLWKGIAALAARRPHCRYLFGAVSVSDRYSSDSRALIARFLRQHSAHPDWRGWATGRRPFSVTPGVGRRHGRIESLVELKRRIAEIEGDGTRMPVLVGEYLKLGGKLLALHVDPDFNDSLDALMVVDLATAPPRRLRRFLGEEAARIQARWSLESGA